MSSSSSPVLKKVLKANLCAGCGLCAGVSNGAIEMGFNEQGYLRPTQSAPVAASVEKKIAACCPGNNVSRPQDKARYHPIWGAYEAVHVGWSTNESLRHHGSSGAVLSAIADHLVRTEKVEFVLTIQDDLEDPISNVVSLASSFDDVYRSAGSRYAPSAPLSRIGEYLDSGRRFAIIAKPCDISALRALSKLDPRVSEQVPFMLSFFCAGVPSRTGARRVLEKLSVKEEDLSSFQYRGDGWPGSAKAVRKDGSTASMSYSESWGEILSKFVQYRCKVCPDGTGGAADLVCADAWYSDEKGYPLFENERGQSLVLARTPEGVKLLNTLHKNAEIELKQFEIENLMSIQPGQVFRSRALLARLIGLFLRKGTLPRFIGFSIRSNSFTLRGKLFLRNLLGSFRRA